MLPPDITPLPVPAGTRSIVLFGGVFDPPHWAHIELATAARDALEPEAWLVFVPAARSPHKPDGPIASNEDRLAMLRLALEGRTRVAIWTDELDRAGTEPSYWVDTLERARAIFSGEIRFLIGADQVLAFHRWHRCRDVLAMAEPVVMLRQPADTPARLRAGLRATRAWTVGQIDEWLTRVVPHEVLGISSTALRERLRNVEGPIAARSLDDRVRAYIEEHALYRGA